MLNAQMLSTTGSVGSGSVSWTYPMHTYYHDARTQVIYPQSDLGDAAMLQGLALNVTTTPGHRLDNWTIRMKHTSQSVHSPASWEGPDSGWTTVYQANDTISSTGWNWFDFSTPFDYNGTDNLMIDFSFNTAEWTSNGEVQATVGSAGQSITFRSDSNDGDPLDWSGTTPTPASSDNVPNIRLRKGAVVSLSPTQTTAFVSGVWSGSVTVGEEADDVFLRATSGEVIGDSNTFDVEESTDPNYGMRDDGGVNLPTLTYWHTGISDRTEQGDDFGGRELGEVEGFFIKGAAIQVWKRGGDVTGANFNYKVWEQGGVEPAYTTRSVGWTTNDIIGETTNQTWASFGAEIDMLDGLEPGDYNVKVLFDITGTGVPGLLADGPFTATFSIPSGPVVLPEAETLPATNITATSVRLRGRVLSDGGGEILERRFDWGKGPVTTDFTADVTVVGDEFYYDLAGLDPETLYYYGTWVRNSAGWTNSPQLTFTTLADDPEEPTQFVWGAISATQTANTPFSVSITAADEVGSTVTDFTGTATLSAHVAATGTVGSGSLSWVFPLFSYWEDARSQTIYLQSELGNASTLNGLALEVTQLPPSGTVYSNWTIRMKHTALGSYVTPDFEGPESGWTTVHQSHMTVPATGWVWFAFNESFDYNGSDNLMIDYSFNNTHWTTNAFVRISEGTARTAFSASDSDHGNPLDWTGTNNPTAYLADYFPNIRLLREQDIAMSPTQTTAFVSGVWSGSVTVGEEADDVFLRATSGEVIGDSNTFDVEESTDPNYGMRDDDGVNLPTLTYWHTGISDRTEQGDDFGGRELGEIEGFFIKGAAIQVWKRGGDVTGANFNYKVWEQGGVEPAYTTRSVGWTTNEIIGETTNQTWASFGAEIDMLDGLEPGDYNVKVLFDLTGTGVPGLLADGPFTATFSIPSGPVVLPEAETLPATNITATAARLRGRVLSDGGGEILERRLEWGISPVWSHWTSDVVVAGSDFHHDVTDLEPDTLYQFRAWARNSAGWTNTAPATFSTSSDDPEEPTQFVWGAISVTQTANTPFSVSIAAADEVGSTVTDFTGTAALSAHVASTSIVEEVTNRIWGLPLRTSVRDSRLQTIYWHQDLGGAGIFKGLALNVYELPGESLDNWTIRMRYTDLNGYPDPVLEGPDSGWTTVFSDNTTVDSTGWVWFDFETPFVYNGVSNLMIDFSFANASASTTGRVYVSTGVVARSVYASSSGVHGDPLDWSGAADPTAFSGNPFPNIRLLREQDIAMSPTQTTAFVSGVWSGSVTVEEEADDVFLRATSADVSGDSAVFDVLTDIVPPPNDLCSGALALTDGVTVTQNTANATSAGAPLPSCQSNFGKEVWYSFTPHLAGTVTVSTVGTDFDAVVAVYSGSCGDLTEVACGEGDSADWNQFAVDFAAEADATYLIMAGGYFEASGHLSLTATLTPYPPAAPIVQGPSGIGQTSFTANWLASDGATNYLLDVSISDGFGSFVPGFENKSVGDETSALVDGLAAGETYYYRVRAQGVGGVSANSATGTATTSEEPPNYGMRDDDGLNLPTLTYWHTGISDRTEQGDEFGGRELGEVEGFFIKGAAIQVWKRGGDVTGANFNYKVWEQAGVEPAYTTRSVGWTTNDIIGETTNQTWASFGDEIDMLDGLEPGDYNVKILFDITGTGVPGLLADGPFTATFSVAEQPEPPEPPLVLAATDLAPQSFTANWEPSAGATNYLLDVSELDTFGLVVPAPDIIDEPGTSGDLPAGWDNVDISAETAADGYLRFTSTESVLETPTLDLSQYVNVELSFDVAKYQTGGDGPLTVQVSTDGGATWTAQEFDSPIPTSATYSNSGPTAITALSDSVRIRWIRADSPSQKRLRNIVLTGDLQVPSYVPGYENRPVGNITSASVTGLVADTTYYYRLRAQNADGMSSYSAVESATTAESPMVMLTVNTAHGTAMPAGTTSHEVGSGISAFILDSPVAGGEGVQYVCTGAAVSGSQFTQVSPTQVDLTLTNHTTLTWQWSTNYWLAPTAGPHGSVNVMAGWRPSGVTTTILATAGPFYHFAEWSGDVPGHQVQQNPLHLLMDAPRTVEAVFAANMTTSSPVAVPEQWLDDYGLEGDYEELASQDSSGDGVPNWMVYVMDRNPTVSGDVLKIEAEASKGPDNVLRWFASSNRVYALYWGTNMLEGVTNVVFTGFQPTEGDVVSHTDTVHAVESGVFYRLKVELP